MKIKNWQVRECKTEEGSRECSQKRTIDDSHRKSENSETGRAASGDVLWEWHVESVSASLLHHVVCNGRLVSGSVRILAECWLVSE